MATPTGRSFTKFTAYELPAKKWMKWICPKVRLRVRGKTHEFVSPAVQVGPLDPQTPGETRTYWAWEDDGRPLFADADEQFKIIIERWSLFGYRRIQRTKLVKIDQVRPDNDGCCTLTLYDGQYSSGELEAEERIGMGKISFTLVEKGPESPKDNLQ